MKGNRVAWLIAAAVAWGWTWRHLSIEWMTNEQYQYGLGVPPLVVLLAWRRWPGRCEEGSRGRVWVIAVAGWVVFSLGELLRWHDPIWRATGGLLAAGATLVTVAGFWRIGGSALVRREGFPLLFAWVAVPWPVPIELYLTQNLLHFVTSVTAGLLGLMGIGVLQHGNAIEMSNGVLGIDDACSGIRSLQASLMAALFLGEYMRLTWGRRVGLVAGGAVVALGLNCVRVLGLALTMHARGSAVAMRYHDAAGDAATAATFAGVLLLALWMGRGAEEKLETGVSGDASGFDGAVACAAYAAVPVLAWVWFASIGAMGAVGENRRQWTLSYSHMGPAWQAEAVEPRPGEREGLRFSTWQGCQVETPEGWKAQVLHIGWRRGKSMPSLAFYHTPELCMPWVGWTETGQPHKMNVPARMGAIPCVAYRFGQEGQAIVVLQSLSNGGETGYHVIDPQHMEDRWHRLRTLWQKPLRQVNEELLVYLPDFGGEKAESDAAAEVLNAVIAGPER